MGKTTTCLNLGFMLRHLGYNVLLIDCDQQCSLTKCLLGNPAHTGNAGGPLAGVWARDYYTFLEHNFPARRKTLRQAILPMRPGERPRIAPLDDVHEVTRGTCGTVPVYGSHAAGTAGRLSLPSQAPSIESERARRESLKIQKRNDRQGRRLFRGALSGSGGRFLVPGDPHDWCLNGVLAKATEKCGDLVEGHHQAPILGQMHHVIQAARKFLFVFCFALLCFSIWLCVWGKAARGDGSSSLSLWSQRIVRVFKLPHLVSPYA